MELNKIYRRQYIDLNNVYDTVKADFTELFSGFAGVSTEEAQNRFKIYFDGTQQSRYIKIVPSNSTGALITMHCNDGSSEQRDWINLCGNVNGSYFSYSFAKTNYGVVFSVLSTTNDSTYSIPDCYIQNFFSTFEDEYGNTVNGFIHTGAANDDMGNTYITYCTDLHDTLENVEISKCFLGAAANHTLLCNAFSYTKPLVAPRLYKKLQTEGSVFGKIRVGGKTLIAGSHFAVECTEE